MIRFDVITLFPDMFESYFDSSILGRAQKNKRVQIAVHNLRDWAPGKHHITDDIAYGGISGMVLKVEPIYRAVEKIKKMSRKKKKRVILLSAKGKVLTQARVRALAKYDQLIFITGHYKGVDERVEEHIADEELSVGEYVITGGEVPAMLVVDAVSRMIPGVIGDARSKEGESFSKGVQYEHGVYTRPEIFIPKKGVQWIVPKVLVSGDHRKIEEWRRKNRVKIIPEGKRKI
jgi:tRNA (guanine37-N1)-methyltransferase